VSRRLTLADIEAEIAVEHYFNGHAAAAAGVQVGIANEVTIRSLMSLTICVLTLHNGHKEVGINYGSVDPAEFNAEDGRRYAREDAISKLWNPLGFRLRDQLERESAGALRVVQTCTISDQPLPALSLADAEADVAGVARPDSPGLNTNTAVLEKTASVGKSETGVAMQAKPSVDIAQQVRDREVSGRALGAALGAGAAQLSIGRLVHYVLSLDDAAKINGRRTNGAAIQDRILEDKWSIGAQAHIGNTVCAGDVLPAMVVRVLPCQQANLQVFLDGNDVFWATTRAEAAPGRTEPGRWHWPARV